MFGEGWLTRQAAPDAFPNSLFGVGPFKFSQKRTLKHHTLTCDPHG